MIEVTEKLTIENDENVNILQGKKQGNIISYSDPIYQNYLIIKDSCIILKRTSKDIESEYIFKENETTDVTYLVNGHNICGISIETNHIFINENEVNIQYSIALETKKQCSLNISYKCN